MAVLGGIKNMFSRKEKSKDFNPLNTTWIMDKMNLSNEEDEKALKPLPLVGHLASRAQMGIMLGVMIFASLLFAVVAFLSFNNAGRYAEMRAISTEMQMLSQRLSRGMSQALLGYGEGFEVMENSYTRFGANLVALRSRTGFLMEVPEQLETISQIWDRTFSPDANRLSIQSLIDQKGNLLSLSERINLANSSDALLNILARDFMQLATTRMSARDQVHAAQLPFLISQMSRYTNSLLSGESYNPEWVPLLLLSVALLMYADPANLEPFAPHGMGSLLPAVSLVSWLFIGMESVTVPAEEIRVASFKEFTSNKLPIIGVKSEKVKQAFDHFYDQIKHLLPLA